MIATEGCPVASFRNPSKADVRNLGISLAYLDTGSRSPEADSSGMTISLVFGLSRYPGKGESR
jgi:hypothetical protein